jgi:hypothetical protein
MTLESGTQVTPRDEDAGKDEAAGSRNANDDAARDGRSDSDDDELESLDEARLRERLREMRKAERKRNDGYNTLRSEHESTMQRLAALEREKSQGAPLEDRVKSLENDIAERDKKIARMEQERKDERTEADIASAARRLNAADPEDVVRLLDRDDLQIDETGRVSNAEQVVRALLKKKPHLARAGGGGADGGTRGQPGKGSVNMNDLLRGGRRSGGTDRE